MEGKGRRSVAKRLWRIVRIVRIVYFMLREGFTKRKLSMELQLLLKRGRIARKAISGLIRRSRDPLRHHCCYTASGGYGGGYYSAFSCRCRSAEPGVSYFTPHKVEFSCSNTPSYPLFRTIRKSGGRGSAAIHEAIEIVDFNPAAAMEIVNPCWTGQLTIAGSPFEEAGQLRFAGSPSGEVDRHVDLEAEDFIRRFYEQLRMQPGTPIQAVCW